MSNNDDRRARIDRILADVDAAQREAQSIRRQMTETSRELANLRRGRDFLAGLPPERQEPAAIAEADASIALHEKVLDQLAGDLEAAEQTVAAGEADLRAIHSPQPTEEGA